MKLFLQSGHICKKHRNCVRFPVFPGGTRRQRHSDQKESGRIKFCFSELPEKSRGRKIVIFSRCGKAVESPSRAAYHKRKRFMLKFTCDRQTFYTAITHVAKGVSQKSTIPALERLKLRLDHDNLELTGYDLEFGIQRSIEVESDCSGEFVILPRLLSEAVRRFSGDVVTMEVDDNYVVKLFCDATEFQISAMSSEEYPALPSLDLAAGMQIEQPVLNSMIRQTSYATSVSEAKPVLTGELFEVKGDTLHVAAIDGYRLAVRQEPISSAENYRFVVPKRTLLEVANMLHDDAEELCTISADRRHVVFEFNGYTVFSRLLEGEFHNYRSSIPSSFETEILLDTSELTRCLERCSLLISGKYNAPVRCTFSGGSLGVWCKTGIGEINDKIPADITGPDVTIGFDNRFLLDAVRAADCDKVKIQLSGGNRVAKLVPPQGESFTFLLMPIQLRN